MSESHLAAAACVDASQFNQPLVFPDRPPLAFVEKAQEAVAKATVESVTEAKLEAIDWEAAQREVNRAIARGGRDPLSPLATDTLALKAVAALLTRVRQTRDGEPTEAFVAALERGEAVAKAIAGGE